MVATKERKTHPNPTFDLYSLTGLVPLGLIPSSMNSGQYLTGGSSAFNSVVCTIMEFTLSFWELNQKQNGRSSCSNMITSIAEMKSLCHSDVCTLTLSKAAKTMWLSSDWRGMLYVLNGFCINKTTVYSTWLNSYLRAMTILKSIQHKKIALLSTSSLELPGSAGDAAYTSRFTWKLRI